MNARGDWTVLQMLLAAGADPDRKNASGISTREAAEMMESGTCSQVDLWDEDQMS